jgi:pimeloyl-ACP methyl ester carboxylesterase
MPELNVNGIRLSYSVSGDGGAPVLLVMGVGWRSSAWQMFATKPLLLAGYRVYCFDNRGTPPSDTPPGPYTVETFADDAIGLMEALGISDCRLWGLSVGGLIVQEITRRRPDLVKGTICHAGFNRHSAFGRLHARAMIDLLNSTDEVPASLSLLLSLKDALRPRALHDDAAVEAGLDFLGGLRDRWDRGFALQLAAALEWSSRDHSEELSTIHRPILVLAAEHDAAFPPEQLKTAAALLPQGEFAELAGANHVPLYGTRALLERCLRFFDRLESGHMQKPAFAETSQ